MFLSKPNLPKLQLLDLLLTNCPTFAVNCKPSHGFCDHDTSILASIFCHPKNIKPVQRKKNCWSRADIDSLRTEIRNGMNNIRTETIETPITNLWNKFKNAILIAQKHHIPTKITSKRFSQPWFNQECKQAV